MSAANETLRREFDTWAAAGRGEGMESDHRPIVEPMLAALTIRPDAAILDVGCGAGWLVRELAARAPRGRVLGLDVSDEMIRRARAASAGLVSVEYAVAPVDSIPAADGVFDHVISVESAYYWPDPAAGVREIRRVLRPGGELRILINFYRDNADCHQWVKHFNIPTRLLSAAEWSIMLRTAGYTGVTYSRIPDPTPTPESYTGRWFRDAAQLEAFRRAGALLLVARPASCIE